MKLGCHIVKDLLYKKAVVAVLIVSTSCLCLFLLGWKMYSLQYNNQNVSNYIGITIDPSVGKTYLCESGNCSVYTYNLSEAYVIDIRANNIELKSALENGKIDLDDLTRYLNYEGDEDGKEIYTWENYRIILSENECVIAPLDIYEI